MSEIAERTELILPGPSEALGKLLGLPMPDLEGGDGLPLLWHWLYMLERPAQTDLGPDGHPIRGIIPAPPGRGQRRMWAGGRVQSLAPLVCGSPATRRTKVLSTQDTPRSRPTARTEGGVRDVRHRDARAPQLDQPSTAVPGAPRRGARALRALPK